jgi:hypothetical protein
MNLCKYKDLLGEPGKGIHSYRIFNIAIADVVLTILAALLISFLAKVSLMWTLLILFLLGIILHRIFCVKTTIDILIFK